MLESKVTEAKAEVKECQTELINAYKNAAESN